MELLVPDNIDFQVSFEETNASHLKYVINADRDDYISVVGNTFACASHGDYFRGVFDKISTNLADEDFTGMKARWKTARYGGYACLDLVLPAVKFTITTRRRQTEVNYRIVAPHGIDGSCSNTVIYGGLESYCSNGQIIGEYDILRRKNSSGFRLEDFLERLQRSKDDFLNHGNRLQTWASKETNRDRVEEAVSELMGKRKAADMLAVYDNEAEDRGDNVYSLYSAMTNYSSHHGGTFPLRKTKRDNAAITMMNREHEVARWVRSDAFLRLAA